MEQEMSSEEHLKKLIETLPMMVTIQVLQAKLLKATYDALVQEGFTEAQALEIIKIRGIKL